VAKITEEDKKRLVKYNKKSEEIVEFSQLPVWVRTYAAKLHVLGVDKDTAFKETRKVEGTLRKYTKSPAYKKWVEDLQEMMDDPETYTQGFLRANSFGVGVEYLAAYDKAIQAGDYGLVAKMSQDLLDRVGIVRQKDNRGGEKITVQLNLGGASIEAPAISSSFEEIPEVDYEVLDNDE